MTEDTHRGLLPAGLADILSPEAEFEVNIIENLMASFSSYGYERVKPPLVEFEDVLLRGSGIATAKQTFRMMDPVSQRMLGIRADMTLQIARIASTRLIDLVRPIRLSYAGQVLRVKGSKLRPKRQFDQIGAELIGSPQPEADAEVIIMATEALTNLGVQNLSVDLGLPTLINKIFEKLNLNSTIVEKKLKTALNQKDFPAVLALKSQLGNKATKLFENLLKAVGPVENVLAMLEKANLPKEAKDEFKHLTAVILCLRKRVPNLITTIDPVETRGYEYHTGVTFTFFASGVRGEIGRGGRYLVDTSSDINDPETATGISLFIDSILRALPEPTRQDRVLVPASMSKIAYQLRKDNWIVVESFNEKNIDYKKKAAQSSCTHYWDSKKAMPIKLK